MPIKSMTGFANSSGEINDIIEGDLRVNYDLEIKSLNSRVLDLRLKLPRNFENLEGNIKKLVSNYIKRGACYIRLNLDLENVNPHIKINYELLGHYVNIAKDLSSQFDEISNEININDLLKNKDIIEISQGDLNEDELGKISKEVLDNFEKLIISFDEMRSAEGDNLQKLFDEYISQITDHVNNIKNSPQRDPENIAKNIKLKVDNLLQSDNKLGEQRLYEEAIYVSIRSDVEEELGRIESHLLEFSKAITDEKSSGRKLEFIAQELSREANTISSKSLSPEISKEAINIKLCLDRIKEQIQNVE